MVVSEKVQIGIEHLKLTIKSEVRARNTVLVIGMETFMATYAFAPFFCIASAKELPSLLEAGPAMAAVLKNMSVPTYLSQKPWVRLS